jgi:hypothetical protein
MITLKEAERLVGFIPSDPYYYDFFLKLIDKHVVGEHKVFLPAYWGHLETLL